MGNAAQLERATATFRNWLYLPDDKPLLAAAGSIAANRMEGDPVWLLLVGPPGGGKSELVNSFTQLPDVHPASTLTEASLLSGAPRREHAEDAKGGLLNTIGEFGILLLKDFTSVLAMYRDERGRVLAALREIYDGSWTRHYGTDGGKTMHWQGRIGLLAGCTPTIDRHYTVMGAMGERFAFYRFPAVDEAEQARHSIAHAGKETEMRQELAAAMTDLLSGKLPKPRVITNDETERLISLGRLIVRARSAVERDNYSREIELVGDPEAPTRFVVVLKRMLEGLEAIGCTTDKAWETINEIAFSSMPQIRRDCLDQLAPVHGQIDTTVVAEELGYPASTVRRSLEDLTAHGLVHREHQGEGKANLWQLTAWTRERYSELGIHQSYTPNGSTPTLQPVKEEEFHF